MVTSKLILPGQACQAMFTSHDRGMTEGWPWPFYHVQNPQETPCWNPCVKNNESRRNSTVPLILCVLITSILLFRHISTTPMGLSLTMDFSPCWNALRFTALCGHFILFSMAFTRQCAKQRKKKHGSQEYVRIIEIQTYRKEHHNISQRHIPWSRTHKNPGGTSPGPVNFCKTSAKNVRRRTIWVKQTCLYYDNHIYIYIYVSQRFLDLVKPGLY